MVSLIREIRGVALETEQLSAEDRSKLAKMISDELKNIGEKMQETMYINGYPITALNAHLIVSPDRTIVNLFYLVKGNYYECVFPLDLFYSL